MENTDIQAAIELLKKEGYTVLKENTSECFALSYWSVNDIQEEYAGQFDLEIEEKGFPFELNETQLQIIANSIIEHYNAGHYIDSEVLYDKVSEFVRTANFGVLAQ